MKFKVNQNLKAKCVEMNKGINMEKVQEKIPEYENNETAPNFCNNFWTKPTVIDPFFRMKRLKKLTSRK